MQRLQQRSWSPPPIDNLGVYSTGPRDHDTISYPSIAHDLASERSDPYEGFWVRHRVDVVSAKLRSLGIGVLWDVGAGNGNMAVPLSRLGFEIVAVEPFASGAQVIARNSVTSICGTLDELQLPSDSLPAIGMFDVMEHIEQPISLLKEVLRVLEPGGYCIVTVPSGQWLWGDIDDALGHYRRYSKGSLEREMSSAGFSRVVSESFFACLVPPAALVRALPYRLGIRRRSSNTVKQVSDQLSRPGIADKAVSAILRTEQRIAQSWQLPVGLSLLGVYQKPQTDA